MQQPFGSRLAGILLAAAFLMPPGSASDPRSDASTWYTFAAEKFSRSDGATALYESTRRRAGQAARRTEGTRHAAAVGE